MMLRIGWPEQLLEQLRRSEIDVAAFCLSDGINPPTDIEADALESSRYLWRLLHRWICLLPQRCKTSRRFPGS